MGDLAFSEKYVKAWRFISASQEAPKPCPSQAASPARFCSSRSLLCSGRSLTERVKSCFGPSLLPELPPLQRRPPRLWRQSPLAPSIPPMWRELTTRPVGLPKQMQSLVSKQHHVAMRLRFVPTGCLLHPLSLCEESSASALPAFRRAANWFMASNLSLIRSAGFRGSSRVSVSRMAQVCPLGLSISDICCKSFGSASMSD